MGKNEIIDNFNKFRILNMAESIYLCICPNCKREVFPRYVLYFGLGSSHLYWCPECLKGKAKCFWIEL